MPRRNARKQQIEQFRAQEISDSAHFADSEDFRMWGTRGVSPKFAYTLSTRDHPTGAKGYVSCVMLITSGGVLTPIPESFATHRTRKAAKARAWNLYQGWRLGRGLKTTWRSFA